MKFYKKFIRIGLIVILCVVLLLSFAACGELKEWDNLNGGKTAEVQDPSDTSDTEGLSGKEAEILGEIGEEQKNTEYSGGMAVTGAVKIEEPGSYKLSGVITGQINVKAEGVTLYLDNCQISNIGKKVISSDYDLIIILMKDTINTVSNMDSGAAEANAVSTSGKLTINGSGKLTILSTKSGIKADSRFYGLGGELEITAGTGHGISADSCILTDISIAINSAAKDGIHAETEDAVLEADPVFDSGRGFVYIGTGALIDINGIYGDGIQSDTYALIDGGLINISTLPTFVAATSNDSCYKLAGGIYSKVAAESSVKYSGLYQLQDSCKGIKVGEIDYTAGDTDHVILNNTAYSLIIAGGQINITTTDDGLHTNSGNLLLSGGVINIETSDDAVAADKNLKITGGKLTVSKSYEAIEAETIDISGGYIKAVATDDGINASSDATTAVQKATCYIKISGGVIYVSSGGDGVDSNGGIQISGGELYVSGPTSGADAALDSETGIVIDGGVVIALGSSGMVQTPATNSKQYCISINLSTSASGSVTVKSSDTILFAFVPSDIFGSGKNYQSIVISSPDFINGKTYSIISGSNTTSATISGIITKIGNSVGPGGPR